MNIKIEHANSLPMPTWRWLKLMIQPYLMII